MALDGTQRAFLAGFRASSTGWNGELMCGSAFTEHDPPELSDEQVWSELEPAYLRWKATPGDPEASEDVWPPRKKPKIDLATVSPGDELQVYVEGPGSSRLWVEYVLVDDNGDVLVQLFEDETRIKVAPEWIVGAAPKGWADMPRP